MKHFNIAILAAAFMIGLAWSALAQEDTATTKATTKATTTATTATTNAIEYKVVPMSDIHARTLDYVLESQEENEGGILGLFKSVDDQLAKKTEDLLNEMGAEGWELLHYSKTSLILMRRAD